MTQSTPDQTIDSQASAITPMDEQATSGGVLETLPITNNSQQPEVSQATQEWAIKQFSEEEIAAGLLEIEETGGIEFGTVI